MQANIQNTCTYLRRSCRNFNKISDLHLMVFAFISGPSRIANPNSSPGRWTAMACCCPWWKISHIRPTTATTHRKPADLEPKLWNKLIWPRSLWSRPGNNGTIKSPIQRSTSPPPLPAQSIIDVSMFGSRGKTLHLVDRRPSVNMGRYLHEPQNSGCS